LVTLARDRRFDGASDGSVPSIRIVISRPVRRSRIGTDRIWVSSSLTLGNGFATSRRAFALACQSQLAEATAELQAARLAVQLRTLEIGTSPRCSTISRGGFG
jgi:hypothetical protein